jgi:hypothetical protein
MLKSTPHGGNWRSLSRLALALALAAALPAACAVPEPPRNPFVGAWMTPEHNQVAFRDDTVVLNLPGGPPTAMSRQTCTRAFRFGYASRSRDALIGLAPRQPDLRRKLTALLLQPDYQVAELGCDEGDTTYVLLGDHELVAIYRDHDIAGLDRLSRL